MSHAAFLAAIWSGCRGDGPRPPIEVVGSGVRPSRFDVTGLATASIGAAAACVAALAGAEGPVVVDRTLSGRWFGLSLRPVGWELAPAWDAVAGDYRTGDGWIRLHTNAPHHRAAALRVLRAEPEREAVAHQVAGWTGEALETAVVEAGGCAAAMRTAAEWAVHPQGAAVAAEPVVASTVQAAGDGERWAPDPARPLAGVRVLDLTRVLAGPVATRFLAGFGADVLRIDPPDWDEPPIIPDVTLGKRCARLDLRREPERLAGLLAEADVLVHGYRPGALDGLGFSDAERQRLRPGLIDVCLDAYGWSGPWSGRRGFDSLVQMSSGIAAAGMAWAGRDQPTPLPVQALDHATGYIMAATVVAGLIERRRSGAGLVARASLARTAAVLTSGGQPDPEPAAAADDREFASTLERTPWGEARRLRPPVQVQGAPMRWDRPASALGSAPAAWTSG